MLLSSQGLLIQVLLGFAAGVAVTTLANVCTTVYLHRGIAHRAIRFRRPADVAFRVVLWLTTGIRVRQWVAVHRKHHAHTDTPDDPHSPA
ncbi:MAG: fatty acid desaturase, partial [Ilumatobacteraceae bacterium]